MFKPGELVQHVTSGKTYLVVRHFGQASCCPESWHGDDPGIHNPIKAEAVWRWLVSEEFHGWYHAFDTDRLASMNRGKARP